MKFPKIQSTFGITPYNPDRDSDEKRRAIFEHYQSQMGAQPLPPETLPWNKPFPPGVEAQQAFDTMLQERVVDPLARAGYEDLGAGLASIPSAAHEMIVPQTEFDVAGTIIPLPGVAKAMKQGKYRKIRAAMEAEDPEKVGEIIAKQAGKRDLFDRSKKTAKIMQEKQSTKTENPFRLVTENLDESKLSPVQEFWNKIDDPEGTLKKTYDELATTAASPYVGDNIANPVFQIDRKGLPTAQMPVEHFSPKNNHVGIGVELGRPDPFAWMDVKLGVSKNWLKKSKGKPRLIETMSDLIAHDEYMDHLNRGDRVVFHIYSTNPRVNRTIVPGAPSVKRIIDAAKKLQGEGVNAKIVVNKIPEMNKLNVKGMTLPEMRETGVRFEERNLGLDEEQLDRLRKVFGDF